MCGIAGIVSNAFSPVELRRRLDAMTAAQRARGPDAETAAVYPGPDGWVGFGFARLAIIDLEGGMQPIRADDGTTIVCNGQIYNYLELRSELGDEARRTKGDVEEALHAYRRFGKTFVHKLNGMFAGAIFDPRAATLTLFRDRFGVKPLYYAETPRGFVFASEIKALFASGLVTPKLDARVVRTHLTYRYTPGPDTLFAGVRKLPPGALGVLDLTRGRFTVERWWQFRHDLPVWNEPAAELEDELARLVADAVRLRMRSDVEVGAFLSGGVDSSVTAALGARANPALKTFTVGFDDPDYDERPAVNALRAALPGVFAGPHREPVCTSAALATLPELVRTVEEPIALAAMMPTDIVCRTAAAEVKVVLTGEGADEVFGGYRKFVLEAAADAWPTLDAADRAGLAAELPELEGYIARRPADRRAGYIESERLFSTAELDALLGGRFAVDPPPFDVPDLAGGESALGAMLTMESRFRLPNYVILRLDKLSMHYGLEARTPFLDYRIAEFAARIPPDMLVDLRTRTDKAIARRAFERAGYLPGFAVRRPKLPFTAPWARWLADATQRPPVLAELLEGGGIGRQGLFDPAVVSGLLGRLTVGAAAGVLPATLVSDADRLLAIVVFSLWYDAFFGAGAPA